MKYFQVYELVDRLTYEQRGDEAISVFNPEVLIQLDNLREYFGVPITINNWHSGGSFEWRGWRTPEKAKELGAPHSQHRIGNAIDGDVRGMSADDVRAAIIANKDHPLLCRIQRLETGITWVHFDLMWVPDRIHLFHA
jgi:hypothetical protein